MAFRWWADDGPLLVIPSPHQVEKKNVAKVGPPVKKLFGSPHANFNKADFCTYALSTNNQKSSALAQNSSIQIDIFSSDAFTCMLAMIADRQTDRQTDESTRTHIFITRQPLIVRVCVIYLELYKFMPEHV